MAFTDTFKTMRMKSIVTTTAMALAVLSLASCQFAPIVPENLEFNSTLFPQDALDRRVGKVGFGGLQFIAGQNGSHRAAIVHIAADDLSVISDFYHHSRVVLRTWTELKNADLTFGDGEFLNTSLGEVRYERFSYSENSCFQFYRVFNRSMSDDFTRERTIIAGYYCNDAGKELDEKGVSELIHGVRLDPMSSWAAVEKEDTSDLFAPRRQLFEIRLRAPDGYQYLIGN